MIGFASGLLGQSKFNPRELMKLNSDTIEKLSEVNAVVFRPIGYELLNIPRIPDSLFSYTTNDPQKKIELTNKKLKLNPYLIFGGDIKFKKDDIFISYTHSWIRLSSYYKYNNEDITEEEFRLKVNGTAIDLKKIPSYYGHFDLLDSVGNKPLKLINADAVNIYDTNVKYKFKDSIENYESILLTLVKYDLGSIHVMFFFPLGQREKAIKEINGTWGLVQFKKDEEFRHPDRSGVIPKPEHPELYFGKFSHLNNPDQEQREREQYKHRMIRQKSGSIAMEGIRLSERKKFNEAKSKFEEALRIDSTDTRPYTHLFLISLEEDQKELALTYWNKLDMLKPAHKENYFLKGLYHKRFNELDSANHNFEYLVENLDTINYRAFQELAFIRQGQNNFDAAEGFYLKALNIFEKEREKARRDLGHRMLNINELFMVRINYARMLISINEPKKAIDLLQETLKDDQENKEFLEKKQMLNIYGRLIPMNLADLNFTLSRAYAHLRDEENMIKYLQTAKDFGKNIPEELKHFLKN